MGECLNYNDPKKEASSSGAHRFPKATQQWLQLQDTYTLHKSVRKNFKRRKTILPGVNFQMQADLIDFFLLKSYNGHYKYILVVIDVFSKKAFTDYLKNKSRSDMIQAFEQVMPEIGKFPKLQTDMGSEFLNRPFQTWLKQHHIEHFHTQNFDTKATIVKRFIRTFEGETMALFYLHQQPKIRGCDAYSGRILQQHLSLIHSTCSKFSQCRKSREGLAHALCRSRVNSLTPIIPIWKSSACYPIFP